MERRFCYEFLCFALLAQSRPAPFRHPDTSIIPHAHVEHVHPLCTSIELPTAFAKGLGVTLQWTSEWRLQCVHSGRSFTSSSPSPRPLRYLAEGSDWQWHVRASVPCEGSSFTYIHMPSACGSLPRA